MPHRVANFFRSSTDNISTTASALKSAARRRDSSSSRSRSGRTLLSERTFSYAASVSDEGDDFSPVRMPEASSSEHPRNASNASVAAVVAASHKKHRLSLPFGRSSKDHDGTAALDWKIESPPAVFFGDAETSTGALVSGQLLLTIREERLEIDSFDANMSIHVVQKRPFTPHCHDCQNQYTELKSWNFLTHPTTLTKGTHQFPFSILLGGHLPASTDTPLMSISYEFKAEALVARSPTSSTGSCAPIRIERVLPVKRSLVEPEVPHHSVRIFPPTNIKASAHYDQVVHPTGKHTMSLRLDGLVTANVGNNMVEVWKLKKFAWRLEEVVKTIAPACDKHAPAAGGPAAPGTRKGLPRNDTRVLGEKTTFDGWKADYSKDGTVELEFDYGLHQHKQLLALGSSLHAAAVGGGSHQHYACDSKSQDGTEVSHTLMLEMVVSKEFAPSGKMHLLTQTGTGRILRMHYAVNLTEFPGLGVSWDNEAPPLYQDVPPSPPTYADEPSPIDYDSLESLDGQRRSVEPR